MNNNSNQNDQHSRYLLLSDFVLDDRATKEEVEELEGLVLQDESLAKDFASRLSDQASLKWLSGFRPGESFSDHSSIGTKTDDRSETPILFPFREPDLSKVQSVRDHKSRDRWNNSSVVSWGSAIVLLGISLILAWNMSLNEKSVATLASATDCRWAESANSTQVGSRLGKGRMKLVKGIAKLKFDQGVEVTLEGPADFEILNWKECRLNQGRIVSTVQPGAEGFVVKTPTAILIDRGTVFGVQVSQSGVSDLEVFQGRVDVEKEGINVGRSITTGNAVRITANEIQDFVGEGGLAAENSSAKLPERRLLQISTGFGEGDNAFVQPNHNSVSSFSPPANVLLLKNGGEKSRWSRKVYLKFDLSLLGEKKIDSASLILNTVPTFMGYQSLQPDSIVSVFGIKDGEKEDWNSSEIDWKSSPASGNGKLGCDFNQMKKIGEFVIPQSVPVGRFVIKDRRIVDFLRADTDRKVTMVLICETKGLRESAYVHGIASDRYPNSSGPTLQIGCPIE